MCEKKKKERKRNLDTANNVFNWGVVKTTLVVLKGEFYCTLRAEQNFGWNH